MRALVAVALADHLVSELDFKVVGRLFNTFSDTTASALHRHLHSRLQRHQKGTT